MLWNGEIQSYQKSSFEDEQFIQNLKRFLYNLPWNIDIFDSHGKLIWVNKNAQKYWGNHPEQMVGVFNFLSSFKEIDTQIIEQFQKALFGKIATFTDTDYHTKINNVASSDNIIQTTFTPLISSNSEVTHVIAINIQQPTNNDSKTELQNKTDDNIAANSFLKNISHELRTPLNWIIGFSDLIKPERDLMKVKAYNEHINKGGKLMLSTVEMLIDLSLLEKEVVAISHDKISINQVLDDTKNYLVDEIQNNNKNLSVRIKNFIENTDQYTITSDLEKLRKIINSLIQNALKFTKEGFIEIGCLSMKDNSIMFYIKDSGIGMSRDIRDHISDIFSQSKEEFSNSLTGRGLGLSIVKKYVNVLGGNIWLDSESKKGSTFFFTVVDLAKPDENENTYNITGAKQKLNNASQKSK